MRPITLLCAVLMLLPAWSWAETFMVKLEGTVTRGIDRGTSSANRNESLFGSPGALDGRPFTLILILDDGVGTAAEISTSAGPGTSLTGSGANAPARATIVINGTGYSIGGTQPVVRRSEIRRIFSPAFGVLGRSVVEFTVDEASGTSSSPADRRELFIQISNDSSSGGQPPFVDNVDWRQPFTRPLVASDACNQCRFEITHRSADGKRVQATGRLAVSSISISAQEHPRTE